MYEPDPAHDILRLPPLEMADEVPLEGVPESLLLGREILRAVLPEQVHARGGEGAHLLRRVVFARHEDARLIRPAPASLQCRRHVLPHDGETTPNPSLQRFLALSHADVLVTAARFLPVSGPCLRCE